MQPVVRSLVVMAAAAASGCASGGASSAPAAPPTAAQTLAAAINSRWTGNFQATPQNRGALTGSVRLRASGSVVIDADGANEASLYDLVVSIPTINNPRQMAWAVLPGRCGSTAIPILAVNTFGVIEMGADGRGVSKGRFPARLTEPSYHVNVYWNRGEDIGDVATCANLRTGTAG